MFSYLVNKANSSLKGNVYFFWSITVSAPSTNFVVPPPSPQTYPYPAASFIPTALTIRNNSTLNTDVIQLSSNLTTIPFPVGEGPVEIRGGQSFTFNFSGSPFNTASPITGQPWAQDSSGLGTSAFFYSNPGPNTFDVDFIWEAIV